MITVTHATTGAVAELIINKIFGLSHSAALQATLIYADGGAVIPVRETVEQIKALINEGIKGHS